MVKSKLESRRGLKDWPWVEDTDYEGSDSLPCGWGRLEDDVFRKLVRGACGKDGVARRFEIVDRFVPPVTKIYFRLCDKCARELGFIW